MDPEGQAAAKQFLEELRGFRSKPPAVDTLVRMSVKSLWLPGMFLSLSAFLAWASGWSWVALVLAGVFVGTLRRDFVWCKRIAEAWPALEQTINWPLLDQVISKLEQPNNALQRDANVAAKEKRLH